jgi:hypothetical protein
MSGNITTNSQIGVLGSVNPCQRTRADMEQQKLFFAPAGGLSYNQKALSIAPKGAEDGVLGSDSPYQRSVMDIRMAQEFNPARVAEPPMYSGKGSKMLAGIANVENFSYRTVMDKSEQIKFNPMYKDVAEYYCCGKAPKVKPGYFQPRRSLTMDDPYNPYSYFAHYAPMKDGK